LIEAAIGSGVTGVLLVTSGARVKDAGNTSAAAPPSLSLRLGAAALAVLAAAALAGVILALPDPGPTLAPEARRELAATGLGNPVTAVLIAYRSFDTMLEKIVLLLAVVGVWSLAPDRFWGGAPPPLGRANPQGALLLLAKILVPLGIIVGVHMFWIGADAPGGAFQAGAILAAMWMIAMIARVTEPPCVNSRWLRLALIAGPAVFLVVGLAGLGLAGNFFAYPDGFAKPIILVIEAFMLLSITVTLPILVAGPPRRGPKPRRGHKP
jgi:multisubunit Na+/H+ antiporter MnhB subunit